MSVSEAVAGVEFICKLPSASLRRIHERCDYLQTTFSQIHPHYLRPRLISDDEPESEENIL